MAPRPARPARNTDTDGQLLILGAIFTVALLAGGLWLVLAVADAPGFHGGNPATVVIELAKGRIRWTAACWAWLAVELLVVSALVLLGWWVVARWRRRRAGRDAAARRMASRRDVAHLGPDAVAESARRLRPSLADATDVDPDQTGVLIGYTLTGGMPLRQSWEDMAVDVWGPRTGKALAIDTPVLTPHGWVPIKALARGCRVIGRDGQPTTVTGVFPQGLRPAYRMHFSDGASVVCDGEHLWTVRPKLRADKKHPAAWRTWTTAQLLQRGLHRASGGAKFYLPLVDAVAFDGILPDGQPYPPPLPPHRGPAHAERPSPPALPLDAYLLGVLLGDGGLSGGSVRLSTAEAGDLLPLLAPLLPAGVTAKPVSGSAYDWSLTVGHNAAGGNPLLRALRDLGLLGCTSLHKFIPLAYLLAPVAIRIALLQGLLDTADSIDVAGCLEYSTSSPQLAEDVRFLVQSLGGLAPTTRRATRNAPSYRLHVCLPTTATPFRLVRKHARWQAVAHRRRVTTPVRTITAIEPAGEAEMMCISVAAADGLFVIADCVVTHNTTSRAIPAVVASPGPVLVTSTKGDIVDATRGPRAERGTAWVFDPQHILGAGHAQGLWWNPLRGVETITDARRLAEHFAAAEREPGMQRDAFFDPSAEELVANLLLAAAANGRTVLDAYRWSVNSRDDEPAILLHTKGFDLPGDAVNGVINLPDRTRGGIYAGATKMLLCLTEPSVTAWVTPPSTQGTPEFDPATFVASTDTLYLLSQGGPGSPAPLIAALTDRVLRAGETLARTRRGRRLDPALLAVLDEAANICRLRQLPSLYSYYGSHGLPIITILQSYAQGVDVWGCEGMRKLWSAANVRTYGGGVADPEFLDELAKLIGEHDVTTRSTSTSGIGWGDRSVSHQPRRQRILDVSDLHALPRGRMVVYSSGAPPVLARTAPWQAGPYAAAIRESIARWDPDGRTDWALPEPAAGPDLGTPPLAAPR
jgi:hypothetical protein